MKAPSPRNYALWKKRYQIGIAGVLIAIQAFVFAYFPIDKPVSQEIVATTATLCFIFTVASIMLINNAGRYPGAEESSYILPSLALSYGLLILALLMLRVPYSRLLIASTFVTSLAFLSILYATLRRSTKLRIGVVPEGHYEDVNMPNVEWRVLAGPESSVSEIDAVSVDLWSHISDEWERRLATFALEGVPVYDLKHLKESLTGKVQIQHLSENNLGTLSPLYSWMMIKHVADWVFALIALLLLWPLLLMAALAIKLDSPGPAIFRQVRIGYRGKSFQVYKLRTMAIARNREGETDSSQTRDAAMTKDGDHRITRVGRFLRQSRIDELPQLINVLKGEMSWIGPRPEAQILSQWYESEIPFYPYRHIVRPGITGWAQVHQGHVADVQEVTSKLHFDFYYIKNFSLWIDLIVVGRTIKTIMTGFGAR